MEHIFILNRETGKSLFPVEERPVPASTVKGEATWPTQPIPVLPLPLGIQKNSTEDAWGVSPEGKAAAEKRIARYTNQGIFIPPSYDGSLVTPGNVGGIHWGGMSFDTDQGLLITNINRLPAIIRMIPREELKGLETKKEELLRAETGRQEAGGHGKIRTKQGCSGGVQIEIDSPMGLFKTYNHDPETGRQTGASI
jgi:quinoprotein glucose dehydrogenase